MSHVIAFANHKGGCSKTTTTANLGVALAARPIDRRVLLIDADPQANLSELFGIDDPRLPGLRLEHALSGSAVDGPHRQPWRARPPLASGEEPRALPHGVALLPCGDELETVAQDGVHRPDFAFALRRLVNAYRSDFDYILIDTPPGRQPLSTLALLAADWIIAPVRPADLDVAGAVKLADLVEAEIIQHNPDVRLIGVLLTQVDRRWRLGNDARQVLDQAGIAKFRREIPFAVRIGEAPRHGLPTAALEPDGRVGAAYRDVAIDLDAALQATTSS